MFITPSLLDSVCLCNIRPEPKYGYVYCCDFLNKVFRWGTFCWTIHKYYVIFDIHYFHNDAIVLKNYSVLGGRFFSISSVTTDHRPPSTSEQYLKTNVATLKTFETGFGQDNQRIVYFCLHLKS